MKSRARIVVVGGGVFGASILYHLAREGWSDVVLVAMAWFLSVWFCAQSAGGRATERRRRRGTLI